MTRWTSVTDGACESLREEIVRRIAVAVLSEVSMQIQACTHASALLTSGIPLFRVLHLLLFIFHLTVKYLLSTYWVLWC